MLHPTLKDCYVYQTMSVPGLGVCVGDWDHRNTVDEYLGFTAFDAKTVLDVGPANGFFTFEMEKRGADVTALDLGQAADWDAVPNAQAPWDEGTLREQMREGARLVENFFWMAHEALGSKARMVHGSVYDVATTLDDRVDIALMGNVLQHLRDPVLAIQRVAQVVRERIIVTESIWHDDEAFLASAAMRFVPRADRPELHHSWWLVSPRLVIEVLKLLGFGRLTCAYHGAIFNGDSANPGGRTMRHYTVTGNRLVPAIVFLDGWHDNEEAEQETWRWSKSARGSVMLRVAKETAIEGPLVVKVGSLEPATISLILEGQPLGEFDCPGPPMEVRTPPVQLSAGMHSLEIRSDRPPRRASEADSRHVGFALYEVRRH
jgi:SAM-dependent methyltransferase